MVDVFTRPDLPATLQVGIDAYTDWDTLWAGFAGNPLGFNSTVIQSPPGNRDLRARIDFIRFASLCPGTGCDAVPFRRGDANADGFFDIGDPLRTLFALFVAGRALDCAKSGDANADGLLGAADAITSLRVLFLESAPLPEPFASCGTEDPASALGCETYPACS